MSELIIATVDKTSVADGHYKVFDCAISLTSGNIYLYVGSEPDIGNLMMTESVDITTDEEGMRQVKLHVQTMEELQNNLNKED